MKANILKPKILNLKYRAVPVLPMLLVVLMTAAPALAQEAAGASAADSLSPGTATPQASTQPVQPPASSIPLWRTRTSPDEGEVIELDDVQIHGEIAQPNVAITVSRAEPIFRTMVLEHVAAAGGADLDLSGLRGHLPPAERIKNWKEMLNRPRQ